MRAISLKPHERLRSEKQKKLKDTYCRDWEHIKIGLTPSRVFIHLSPFRTSAVIKKKLDKKFWNITDDLNRPSPPLHLPNPHYPPPAQGFQNKPAAGYFSHDKKYINNKLTPNITMYSKTACSHSKFQTMDFLAVISYIV